MDRKAEAEMHFMISVDWEGLACVVDATRKALSLSNAFTFPEEQAIREANAAARALFDAGAERVLVWDSHGSGSNLRFGQLDRRCEIMLGSGFNRRFPGVDDTFAGVLMIGYHAMEGTPNAVLAHTYSSKTYRNINVNGAAVGEIAMDAAVVGELGVPVIFLSSDDSGCREGLRFMPWIETVVTKQGFGYHCAHSKHPSVVEEEIYSGVRNAVKHISRMKPFVYKKPTIVKIQYKGILQTLMAKTRRPGWRFSSPRMLQRKISSMLEWRC